ncbi:MAG: sigma-70 family RNA polymerase sigma factor [Actinomycetota bacterium]
MTLGDRFPTVLAAARAGGEWAWEALYREMAPRVLGYLRARGAPEPEDLLGEVFLQAVRDLGSFSGDERSFCAWLFAIAHRRSVDELRRRSRRPQAPADDDVLVRRGPRGDAEAEALERVEARRALDAIHDLSPDQRDVLLLRLVADLTLEDVARILGKRLTAVKALQRRGLAALARKTSREGVSR